MITLHTFKVESEKCLQNVFGRSHAISKIRFMKNIYFILIRIIFDNFDKNNNMHNNMQKITIKLFYIYFIYKYI